MKTAATVAARDGIGTIRSLSSSARAFELRGGTHTLLREPLDGAGNRGTGNWLQQAQVRDLRRTRPCARGFPSVACDAPLAWFADAACVPPHIDQAASRLPRRRALLRGATVSAVTRYRK